MSIYVNTIFKVCFVDYTNGKNTGLNKTSRQIMTYNEELVNDKLIKVRNRLEMAKRR
jgi:hypothetical protein